MWIPVPHTSATLPALAITTWSPQLTPTLLTLLNGTSGTAITHHLRNKIPQPYTQEAADDFLSRVSSPTSLFTSYAIVSHNDGTIVTAIGTIGLTFKDPTDIEAHAAELGYWLAPEYWGKGVMTSVLSAFMKDFVTPLSAINPRCADVPLAKVFAVASLENPGSCMVLEKNGFEREGVLRRYGWKGGRFYDAALYATLL
ncbi:hypothetical protein HDU79_007676 [Rhizoclosmatium sp. JEL0117]|nr:hypothetical protein HDU79_007676 [Rhizoclosmatium sp. JEL0117]